MARGSLLPVLLVAACVAPTAAPSPRPVAPVPRAKIERQKPPAPRPVPPSPGFRLPGDTRPTAYDVTIDVDPAKDELTGLGAIEIVRDQPGDTIYIHGHDLGIETAALKVGDAITPLTAMRVDDETLALQAADKAAPLPTGAATLTLRWRARIRQEDTLGAFRQKTDDAWYVYSQFEAIGARRVLPCFDEPAHKVPWKLTLRVPRGQVALSNSPVEAERDDGDVRVVAFAPTPPLPSYLVAFAVGPFELVDAGQSRGGAPIRIAVPKGHVAEAAYPAAVTAELLHVLEDYFGTPYPFAKLDLVPIPDTVGFGAMENAGLITYEEGLLLKKPSELSILDKRDYAETAAHELAHQWVGNLVTMRWWDDLWLNEAFASWAEDVVMARWQPTWGTEVDVVARKDRAMHGDSSSAGRRIREPVRSYDDVEDAFDGITYGKGASVVHMLEAWLGPDTFQKGLRLYLSRHARGSATYADLAAALAEAAGRDVAPVIDGFVDTTGVPLLAFTLVCEPGQPPRLDLTQRRYLPFASTLDANRTWQVPVVVRWQAGKASGRATTLLTGARGSLALPDAPACPDVVVPNAAGESYYRWTLDDAAFARLLAPRTLRALPAPERAEVANAVLALVGSGDLPYRRGLEIATLLVKDPVRQIRRIGLDAGEGWAEDLPPEVLPRYRAWVKKTYGAAAKAMGFQPRKGESEDERMLRASLLARMVRDADDPGFQKEAVRLAWRWLDDRKSLAPEMVDTVLALAAWSGDDSLHDRLLDEARRSKDSQERERLLEALGGFRQPEQVRRNLQLVLGHEFDIVDTIGLVYDAGQTRAGGAIAWTFVTENYDELVKRLPAEWRARLVRVGGSECSKAAIERTAAFFGPRTPKELGGERAYRSAIERLTLCTARRERDTASFVEFLGGAGK